MAYTSVEAEIYSWAADIDEHLERLGAERRLFPGFLGRGDVVDLAERFSKMLEPYRNFFRAYEGHEGYDLDECLKEARKAEKEL